MRRLLVLLASILLVSVFTAPPASAAGAHFKRGGTPTCTITGTNPASTTCTGTLAGLGNGDLSFTLTVSGTAVYQCQNPGGNIAPGQNRVAVGPAVSPVLVVPPPEGKNGSLKFTTNAAELSAPSTATAAEAGCPSAGWSGVNPTVTVTYVELVIAQGGSTLFTCTKTNANGLTSPVTLTCV